MDVKYRTETKRGQGQGQVTLYSGSLSGVDWQEVQLRAALMDEVHVKWHLGHIYDPRGIIEHIHIVCTHNPNRHHYFVAAHHFLIFIE